MEYTKETIIRFIDNKGLTDSVRNVSINSPLTMEQVFFQLSDSNDYERDTEIVVKLSCAGFSTEKIKQIINVMNN